MGHAQRFDLPHYTYDDYRLWEGRWELIDGIPHAMSPAPSIAHPSVSSKIARLLDEALDECDECRALLPVDWRIAEDTVLQPDNLVVCHPVEGAYITRAPVLIFEVLSKSTALKDQNTKFAIYEREGVKYYAMVAPEDRTVRIFVLFEGRYIKLADVGTETVDFDLGKCRIRLDFSLIW
ncbi:MAG: Uma2 family endonuclease [Halothiobacillaceae bacterium]|nr:MAG: Uma2 family endonuclease [Halothiobacillaceae bacterium]